MFQNKTFFLNILPEFNRIFEDIRFYLLPIENLSFEIKEGYFDIYLIRKSSKLIFHKKLVDFTPFMLIQDEDRLIGYLKLISSFDNQAFKFDKPVSLVINPGCIHYICYNGMRIINDATNINFVNYTNENTNITSQISFDSTSDTLIFSVAPPQPYIKEINDITARTIYLNSLNFVQIVPDEQNNALTFQIAATIPIKRAIL